MKSISSQLSYFLKDKAVRRNTWSLLKYVGLIVLVVILFTVLFHYIMWEVEGQRHSWITGLYWTLTVMSTLGFGDITFTSDIGRLFSTIVLITGIMLLLIVLPFAFIRFFYAPWLDARINQRVPRAVPPDAEGHVIIAALETVAEGLIERLRQEEISYFIIEPDPARATTLHAEGAPVILGEADDARTHERMRAAHARMVLANRADTVNTNIVLTVREVAPEVLLVATAGAMESVDVLELSGATRVLPLKQRLGEQLANRVSAQRAHAHVVGRYEDLLIAEVPVRNTPLAGQTIREARLRERMGLSVIAMWHRGRLEGARADTRLTAGHVPIVTGTAAQLERLDDLLCIYDFNPNPVLVIGGGQVGRAVVHALQEKEVPVRVVERDERLCERLRGRIGCKVYAGDAADYDLLMEAGLKDAPSVVLTTHDDAMNVHLASYCRRLNADLRIISRITHERNLVSIHRAGADFALSYASLGAAALMAILHDKELVVLGEGLDLFSVPLPDELAGQTLAESGIGARTGLIVMGIQTNGAVRTNPPAAATLTGGSELVLLGAPEQRRAFAEVYGA